MSYQSSHKNEQHKTELELNISYCINHSKAHVNNFIYGQHRQLGKLKRATLETMQLWKKQKQQHGPKNQSHSASVWSRWRAGPVGWMRCQQGKLYSDLILYTANQILGPAHPPSLKFRRSGQPRNGIESTSHWKSFVPLSKRGGGHTASWTLLNSCTGIDQSISCVFNVC